jgi:hypothetical protein
LLIFFGHQYLTFFRAKTSKYLHPLVVLEILARNEKLKVADIKDYIVNWLNEQNEFVMRHIANESNFAFFRSKKTSRRLPKITRKSSEWRKETKSWRRGKFVGFQNIDFEWFFD